MASNEKPKKATEQECAREFSERWSTDPELPGIMQTALIKLRRSFHDACDDAAKWFRAEPDLWDRVLGSLKTKQLTRKFAAQLKGRLHKAQDQGAQHEDSGMAE